MKCTTIAMYYNIKMRKKENASSFRYEIDNSASNINPLQDKKSSLFEEQNFISRKI